MPDVLDGVYYVVVNSFTKKNWHLALFYVTSLSIQTFFYIFAYLNTHVF